MSNRVIKIILFCAVCFSLSGCPRVAHVDLYNNTGVDISVEVAGEVNHISSGTSKRIRFTASMMVVESEYGDWHYGRDLIPYGGYEGPYYDGTVFVQLNDDGRVYALKKGSSRPKRTFTNQPEGFPLVPDSHSYKKTKIPLVQLLNLGFAF